MAHGRIHGGGGAPPSSFSTPRPCPTSALSPASAAPNLQHAPPPSPSSTPRPLPHLGTLARRCRSQPPAQIPPVVSSVHASRRRISRWEPRALPLDGAAASSAFIFYGGGALGSRSFLSSDLLSSYAATARRSISFLSSNRPWPPPFLSSQAPSFSVVN